MILSHLIFCVQEMFVTSVLLIPEIKNLQNIFWDTIRNRVPISVVMTGTNKKYTEAKGYI